MPRFCDPQGAYAPCEYDAEDAAGRDAAFMQALKNSGVDFFEGDSPSKAVYYHAMWCLNQNYNREKDPFENQEHTDWFDTIGQSSIKDYIEAPQRFPWNHRSEFRTFDFTKEPNFVKVDTFSEVIEDFQKKGVVGCLARHLDKEFGGPANRAEQRENLVKIHCGQFLTLSGFINDNVDSTLPGLLSLLDNAGQGDTTYRHAAFKRCGSGRKRPNDGSAYDKAIASLENQTVKLVSRNPNQFEWGFVPLENRKIAFDFALEVYCGEQLFTPQLNFYGEVSKLQRLVYLARPRNLKNLIRIWVKDLIQNPDQSPFAHTGNSVEQLRTLSLMYLFFEMITRAFDLIDKMRGDDTLN